MSGVLIPEMLSQFGWKYEPEIGLQQSRIILRDAIQLYREKGGAQGLREVIKSFSGYAVPSPLDGATNPTLDGITIGHNLMLDYNDSSFEEGIGHWASTSNATLTCLQVETIKAVSLTSNVATITTVGTHNYAVGNQIYIQNCE